MGCGPTGPLGALGALGVLGALEVGALEPLGATTGAPSSDSGPDGVGLPTSVTITCMPPCAARAVMRTFAPLAPGVVTDCRRSVRPVFTNAARSSGENASR